MNLSTNSSLNEEIAGTSYRSTSAFSYQNAFQTPVFTKSLHSVESMVPFAHLLLKDIHVCRKALSAMPSAGGTRLHYLVQTTRRLTAFCSAAKPSFHLNEKGKKKELRERFLFCLLCFIKQERFKHFLFHY